MGHLAKNTLEIARDLGGDPVTGFGFHVPSVGSVPPETLARMAGVALPVRGSEIRSLEVGSALKNLGGLQP